MNIGTPGRTLSAEDLRTHLDLVTQARSKNHAVSIGRLHGHLVIKTTPKWNLLVRAYYWVRGKKAKQQYRQEVLATLKDSHSDLALKKDLFQGISSGNIPCFSKAEAAKVRASKTSFFRRAQIAGIDIERKLSKTSIAYAPQDSAAYFVDSEHDKQTVLEHYRSQGAKGEIELIRKPTDFDRNDLARTIVCEPGHSLETSAGRLFSDEPLTLVLDFTAMTPAQIASLNELFDQPPRFQGRKLGSGVALICLVNDDMQPAHSTNPGPDFWRRIDSAGVKPELPKLKFKAQTDQELFDEITDSEFATAPTNAKDSHSIDFSRQSGSWHALLFGGLQLSKTGQLEFKDGILSHFEGRSGVMALHNAPTDNPDFIRELTTAIREGGFWANGQWTPLSSELTVTLHSSPPEDINAQLAQFQPLQPEQPFVCINEDTFDSALSNVTLKDQQLLERNTLEDLVSDTGNIMVSGHLMMSQWIQLINQLQQLTPRPGLAIAPQCPIPKDLDLRRFRIKAPESKQVRLCAAVDPDDTKEVVEFDITPKTQPDTLLCRIPMVSQRRMNFAEHYTPLMEALLAGKPVRLHGLETNPAVARQLESLLAPEPYVFLTGHKVPLPSLNLTCILPPLKKPAGLWQHATVTSASIQQPTAASMERELTPDIHAKLLELHTALKQLPRSSSRLYPDTPQPLNSPEIQYKVVQQVMRETISDNSSESLPYHWRKALNDVIAKEYRGDRKAYGFVKSRINSAFPDPDSKRVDRDSIRQWLNENPDATQKTIKEHYWELARHLTPTCLPLTPTFSPIPDQCLQALLPVVVSCAAPEQQATLAQQLSCTTQPLANIKQLAGYHYRQAYNALMAAGPEGRLRHDLAVHDQALRMAEQLADRPEPLATEDTEQVLEQWFTEKILQDGFKDLAPALISGKTNPIRQLRRIRRLAEKLSSNPMVMLKGEAGTGKSYTAYAVAVQEADGREPLVLSLSPEHTQEDLFGREVLKPAKVMINRSQLPYSEHPKTLWRTLCAAAGYPKSSNHIEITFDRKTRQFLQEKLQDDEFHEVVEAFEDHITVFEPGPLLEWAESRHPPVLILDEANLAKLGVLQPLLGLKKVPPRITIHGRTIFLTDQHRIIMTGNPESYDGRIIDPKLRKETLTLYYRPMSPAALSEAVFTPGLPTEWPSEVKEHATNICMKLYDEFHRVLPAHIFGPRDLKDILARIRLYTGTETPDLASVNGIVWQAVCDTLAGEAGARVSPELRAVKHWYQSHHECDHSAVQAKQQAFSEFYNTMKLQLAGDSFDFSLPSVQDLAYKIWLDLEKTGGKHAVVIEGEAGRGKDALLDRMLPLWLQQKGKVATFDRINASPESWEEIKQLARKAMKEGTVLVISELNTLPSRYLEGFFNEVLNGEATEGFQLIATINPASYSGREAFSEAMQSRCTLVKIPSFTESELSNLLARRYPELSEFTSWLAKQHCRLAEKLEQAGSSVRLPLVKLLASAEAMKSLPITECQAAFDKHYQLAYRALKASQAETKQVVMVLPSAECMERERRLCKVINDQTPQPVVVKLGPSQTKAAFDKVSCTLTLPDNPDFQALMEQAVATMESGNPESLVDEQTRTKMQETLAKVELQEKEAEQLETERAQDDAPTGKVPSSWALKWMPTSAIAGLLKKFPNAAVSILTTLPVHHIGKLFNYIPMASIVGMILKLPLDRLIGLVEYIPWNALVSLINKLPLGKLVNFFSNLPVDRLASFVPELSPERLEELAKKLPVDRLSKAFENLNLEKLTQLADEVPPERFKAMTENLDIDKFKETMDGLKTDKLREMFKQFPVSSEKRAELKKIYEHRVSESLKKEPEDIPEDRAETPAAERPKPTVPAPGKQPPSVKPFDAKTWQKALSRKKAPSASEVKKMQANVPMEHLHHLPKYLDDHQLLHLMADIGAERGAKIFMGLPEEKLTEFSREVAANNLARMINHFSQEQFELVLDHMPIDRMEDVLGRFALAQGAKRNAIIARHRIRSMSPATDQPITDVTGEWEHMIKKGDLKKMGPMKNETLSIFLFDTQEDSESAQVLMGLLEKSCAQNGLIKAIPAGTMREFSKKMGELLTASTSKETIENELIRFVRSYQTYATQWSQRKIANEPPPNYDINAWNFLNTFRSLHKQGLLSRKAYQEMTATLVMQKPALRKGLNIEFLEVLRDHPLHGTKANSQVDEYYETTLVMPKNLSANITKPEDRPIRKLPSEVEKFQVEFLERHLGKRVINQEWSNTPTGKTPNVPRLARREAAFPVQGASSEVPVVVVTAQRHSLEQFVIDELRRNPPVNLQNGERSPESTEEMELNMAHLVMRSFTETLKGHQHQADWKVVVPHSLQNSFHRSRMIDRGTHDFGVMPYMLSHHYLVSGLAQTKDKLEYIPQMDESRMLEDQNEPNAIILDDQQMKECLRDYMLQIPPEYYYEYLSKSFI